jgi:hypothetical protein
MPTIRIGFTGGRSSPTWSQRKWISDMLWRLFEEHGTLGKKEVELHHGDCVGKDAWAHDQAWNFGYRIVLHPPNVNILRAFLVSTSQEVREPKPYMDRNQDIVDEADILLAVPDFPEYHQLSRRSGSWATIRRARKKGIPVHVWEEPH